MNKQAIIFAAGLGTRLKPLTDDKPKALVKVNGICMLDRVIDNLIKYGFDRIIVNVHHFADQIIDHIKQRGDSGARILISDERDLLLDTAGGIRKAIGLIDPGQPLLVHNADILTDLNLAEVYDSLAGADASLLCSAERKSSRYLLFDDAMRMKGWINETSGETKPADIDASCLHKLAFGGIHVLSPTLLSAISDNLAPGQPLSITPFYISVCDKMDICAYMPDGAYQWHDIGSIDKLKRAEALFN